jgi:hypothetical protein
MRLYGSGWPCRGLPGVMERVSCDGERCCLKGTILCELIADVMNFWLNHPFQYSTATVHLYLEKADPEIRILPESISTPLQPHLCDD